MDQGILKISKASNADVFQSLRMLRAFDEAIDETK